MWRVTCADNHYALGAVLTPQGLCNVSSSTSYDRVAGQFTMTFSNTDVSACSSCVNFQPTNFGYKVALNGDVMTVDLDVNSHMTAIAVTQVLLWLLLLLLSILAQYV